MSEYEVVVHDPTGTYWDGSLIQSTMKSMLATKGGVSLPIDAKTVTQGGASGWYKRAWGAGWPMDYPSSQLACRMLLAVPQGECVVNWAAMLVAGPPIEEMLKVPDKLALMGNGILSLASDQQPSLQTATYTPTTQPVGLKGLEKDLRAGKGTCIVQGRGAVRAERSGVHGFAIYGTMPGMRVAWAALAVMERLR